MTKTETIFAFILISAPCLVVPLVSLFQGRDSIFFELARVMLRLG